MCIYRHIYLDVKVHVYDVCDKCDVYDVMLYALFRLMFDQHFSTIFKSYHGRIIQWVR